MKDHYKFIALALGILTLVATIHLLSIKKMEDNNKAHEVLQKQIAEQQAIIDTKQKEIAQLEQSLLALKKDAVVIDNTTKENKNKYRDEKRYIDLATPSQQSALLSTNLSEFKDLDKQGYFDLPEGY